jgi:LPPG:FO 2-phospho-L-lactate transferase
VVEAIESAERVVIGPSNPPLSIWPILAVPGIEEAVRRHPKVIAVSPLIGGKAVKGPADTVMADLGLGRGTRAVLAAYEGLIDLLVVDDADSEDVGETDGVAVVAMSTLIQSRADGERLARGILAL